MDVTQTTVPGVGTVHHCFTRAGQHFGVLTDRSDQRQLLIYEMTNTDEPAHVIALERDEADQVAEILHSRAIPDRMADLERKFSEIMRGAP